MIFLYIVLKKTIKLAVDSKNALLSAIAKIMAVERRINNAETELQLDNYHEQKEDGQHRFCFNIVNRKSIFLT